MVRWHVVLARSWENQLLFGTDEARTEHSGHQVSFQRTNMQNGHSSMLAGCMVAVEQSRESSTILTAVAAHQGPTPIF
jgi:hypothetical protein